MQNLLIKVKKKYHRNIWNLLKLNNKDNRMTHNFLILYPLNIPKNQRFLNFVFFRWYKMGTSWLGSGVFFFTLSEFHELLWSFQWCFWKSKCQLGFKNNLQSTSFFTAWTRTVLLTFSLGLVKFLCSYGKMSCLHQIIKICFVSGGSNRGA